MGEQSLLLWVVFFFMILTSVDTKSEGFVHCAHDRNEQVGILSDSWKLHSIILCLTLLFFSEVCVWYPNESRSKRQSGQQYQPLRIHVYYDTTVDTQ